MVVVYDRVDEKSVHGFLEKLVGNLQRLGKYLKHYQQ